MSRSARAPSSGSTPSSVYRSQRVSTAGSPRLLSKRTSVSTLCRTSPRTEGSPISGAPPALKATPSASTSLATRPVGVVRRVSVRSSTPMEKCGSANATLASVTSPAVHWSSACWRITSARRYSGMPVRSSKVQNTASSTTALRRAWS